MTANRPPDYRLTNLTINNLSVYMVGEVIELLREKFGEDSVEINVSNLLPPRNLFPSTSHDAITTQERP